MRDLSVRTRIVLGFSAVLLIMVVLTGLVYVNLLDIKKETLDLTGDSLPGATLITEIEAASFQDFSLAQRQLLSNNTQQRSATLAEMQNLNSRIDGLFKRYEATIHHEKEKQIFADLTRARVLYQATRRNIIQPNSLTLGPVERAGLERQLQASFQNYYDALETEVTFNRDMATESANEVLTAVSRAQNATIIGILLSIILALLSGWILVQAITHPLGQVIAAIEPMRRGDLSKRVSMVRNDEFGTLTQGLNLLSDDLTSLIGQVQRASIEVNTSVTEIAATSRQQQATASEIAATTTEIGATSKEISATSRELVKSMNDVAGVAEQTATLAADGQTGLARMQSTMHQIMDASGSINSRLSVLNEKAGNINTVVTTIAKVADQTNLLSLNAAIEAEKAGEYGRGFAVVASEIRRLADQTAVATLDIEQMVKEMQSAVSAGVMGMDKFSEEVRRGVEVAAQVSEQLTQIIEQVQTLTPNFEIVNEGMQSQSIGAQQISDALAQLSEAAQQTVESLRQSNLAIEQMNGTVRGLQSGISRFTLVS